MDPGMDLFRAQKGNLPAEADPVSALQRDNAALREEIRVAREAAEITANLVVKQFEETERILRRFQVANAQRKAVLNSATQVGIIATDIAGIIRVFNTGAENLLGYPAEDVIGRWRVEDFLPESERESRAEELALRIGAAFSDIGSLLPAFATQDSAEPLEWNLVRQNGGVFQVSMTVNALRRPDGTMSGILCILSDISERKTAEAALKQARDELEERVERRTAELAQANRELQNEIRERRQMEKALRNSEEKFRGIFENATEGIFQSTPDGRMITANPAMVRRLGYASEAEVVRELTRIREQLYVNPESRDELKALLARDGFVRNFETRYYRKNGAVIDVSLNVHVVRDERGEIAYYEGMMEDITQRKQAEELKIAKEAAEAATRTKSEFLANMSHEIRTPMNAIIGLTELSLRSDDLPLRQRDYLEKLQTASHSLLGIINDILDFSKMEAGRLKLEETHFRLDAVLEDLADLFTEKVAGKGIELVVSAAEDVPRYLVGDPLRLSQVLVNLTNNAVKFTESGEVVVTVRRIPSGGKGVRLRFQVRDTGMGIDRSLLANLFDAFSQADSSTTRKHGGTGLGLTICRQLVRLMDGEIDVDSEPGKGSRFSFTAHFAPAESASDPVEMEIPGLQGRKVLLVDDNETIRQYYAEMLSGLGLETVSVDSGGAAFRELAAAIPPYDLVILDWRMPGTDGITLLERIRQSHGISRVPVVMMTAFGREEVRRRAEACGATAFLIKPVKASLLRDTLVEVFGIEDAPVSGGALLDTGGAVAMEDRERLGRCRLLLVEDNLINQEVILELLRERGVMVETAGNGKAALETLEKGAFDGVLMDVQMPEMDGYEAATRIRADPRWAELPVIAMTAHAMEGDRDRCLAAGMNDFVAKPIDTKRLFDVLSRWISPRFSAGGSESELPAVPEAASGLPPSLPGIDIPEVLARLRRPELIRRLLAEFARTQEAAGRAVTAAIRAGNPAEALRRVHNLKGVAGNLSADRLSSAALSLETALRTAGGDIEARVEAFEAAFQEVMETARKIADLDGPSGPEAAVEGADSIPLSRDPGEMATILGTLAEMLHARDLAAEDQAWKLRAAVAGSASEPDAAELESAVVALDFQQAMDRLKALASRMGIEMEWRE